MWKSALIISKVTEIASDEADIHACVCVIENQFVITMNDSSDLKYLLLFFVAVVEYKETQSSSDGHVNRNISDGTLNQLNE